MIGHTAFLVTARRMAPAASPAEEAAPGTWAYGPDYTGPRPPGVPIDASNDHQPAPKS